MKSVFVIAQNTFREIIRDRILYGLIIFALLLIAVSLALGQLSFKEQARIAINFGLTGIHLSVVILAIFVGSTIVYREIEKQTILTLLARPITRTQFLIGKYLGLAGVIFAVMSSLSVVLLLITLGIGFEVNSSFVSAIIGVYFEALILLAFSMLFGSFSRPTMSVVFVIGIFLIGHWLDSLSFFAKKSGSQMFIFFSEVTAKVLPNLELFNWRAAPVLDETVPLSELLAASGYMFGWVLLILATSFIIFRRKDFV